MPGIRTLRWSLLLGALLAAFIVAIGNRDLENYEHSFFSLNRGTHTETVKVLGQPVFTLALGFGVRLPLHGNLGASPATVVAPFVPEPLTLWLLFTVAFAGAALVVRYALDRLCGYRVAGAAAFAALFSIPMVNYAITDDWPETATTFCAVIVCTFAAQALCSINAAAASRRRQLAASAAVVAVTFGAVSASHPGYWPILALTLMVAAALGLLRTDVPLRTRLLVGMIPGVVAAAAMALTTPDVLREMELAAATGQRIARDTQGPAIELFEANLLALADITSRSPFTLLLLACVALLAAPGSDQRALRHLTAASAVASILLAVAASHLRMETTLYRPSSIWALRDPALVFAVLSGALAIRIGRTSFLARVTGPGIAKLLLWAAGLLGPAVAAYVVLTTSPLSNLYDSQLAPRGAAPALARLADRGVPVDLLPHGTRIAFWPTVTTRMRNVKDSQAEFPDAGYVLVTATTKQRTMAGVVTPNGTLFNQGTRLNEKVLCSPEGIGFLQLTYLLAPAPITCGQWHAMAGEPIDSWLVGHRTDIVDRRVRALPREGVSDRVRRTPAFGVDSVIVDILRPVTDTSVRIGPSNVELRLTAAALTDRLTYVIPVVFDEAWRVSSGTLQNIGGLVGVVQPLDERVVLTFVPDRVATVRAVGIVLSQVLVVVGLLAMASVTSTATPIIDPRWKVRLIAAIRWFTAVTFPYWPHAFLAIAVATTLPSQTPEDQLTVGAALLVPLIAAAVSLVRPRTLVHGALAIVLVVAALVLAAAGGSLSPDAVHDPVFWVLITSVAIVGLIVMRRRAAASRVLAFVVGVTAAVATLLAAFPQFWASLSAPSSQLARESFENLSWQFGRPGGLALMILWISAIVAGGVPPARLFVSAVIARAALIVGLGFTLLQGAPLPVFDTPALITLGVLLGLAAHRKRGGRPPDP